MVLVVPDSDLEHELADLKDDPVGKVAASDVPPGDVGEVELKKLQHELFQVELLVEVLLFDVIALTPVAANLEASERVYDLDVAGVDFGSKLEIRLQVPHEKNLENVALHPQGHIVYIRSETTVGCEQVVFYQADRKGSLPNTWISQSVNFKHLDFLWFGI